MGLVKELYKRYLIHRYKPRHWLLRPDTIDRRVFRHVVIDNEYDLPTRFSPDDVIVDVGAHIGSFSYAVLERGARTVFSCEPDPNNFALLQHNLRPYHPRVHLLPNAVWRSDQAVETLQFHNPGDARNTGEGQICAEPIALRVAALPFDTLVSRATEGGRRIRLLKLDCEGAEWPILFTSQKLHCVDVICGEYHLDANPKVFGVGDHDEFTTELLETHLGQQGFDVRTQPMEPRPDLWGWFFARRVA